MLAQDSLRIGQSKGTIDPRGLRVRVRTGKGPGLAMTTRDPLGYPLQTRKVVASRWLKQHNICTNRFAFMRIDWYIYCMYSLVIECAGDFRAFGRL